MRPSHPHLPLGCLRPRAAAPALAIALALASGCAQPGPFAQRNALVGSLRESVSQLEADKQKLERQVAQLGGENRQLEDRLVQEESYSQELASRLKTSRQMAGRSEEGQSASRESTIEPRTTPARRTPQRKTPMAQIPGEIHPLPESDSFDAEIPPPRSSRKTPAEDDAEVPDLFSSGDSLSARTRRFRDASPWLPPIARRTPGSTDLR